MVLLHLPAIVVVDEPAEPAPGFDVVVDAEEGEVSIVVVVAFAVAEPLDVSDFFFVVEVAVDFFFTVVVVAVFFLVVALFAAGGEMASAATTTTPASPSAPVRKTFEDEVANPGKPIQSRYRTRSAGPGCSGSAHHAGALRVGTPVARPAGRYRPRDTNDASDATKRHGRSRPTEIPMRGVANQETGSLAPELTRRAGERRSRRSVPS